MSKYLAAVPDLTDEEFAAVTAAFVERLGSAMSTAGCNDVFEDEFPKSVCQKYGSDTEILVAWCRRMDARAAPPSCGYCHETGHERAQCAKLLVDAVDSSC